MLDLVWNYMYSNPDTSILISKQLLKFAHEKELGKDFPDIYNGYGVSYIVKSDYDEAILTLDSGLYFIGEILKDIENEEEFKKFMVKKSSMTANKGNCHYHKGSFQQAINHYLSAVNVLNPFDEPYRKSVILSSVGSCYQELKKHDLSLKYHFESLEYAIKSADTATIASVYSNIGISYYLLYQFEKSKKYTLKAIELYENINYEYFYPTVYLNLAQTYIDQDSIIKGNHFLDKAYTFIVKNPGMEAQIFYLSLKAKYYQKLENPDSAIIYALQSYHLSKKHNWEKYKLSTSETLNINYYKLGQFDSAYYYLKIQKLLNDSLFSEESDKRIAEMEVKYQVEKKELQIENLEKQGAYEKRIRVLLIILLLVIVLSSIIIIISNVLRRKKTKQLHRAEKKLMKSELEKGKIEQQKMNEDIEHKSKQLTTHALNMMQKNKLLQEVNQSIADILKNPDKDLPDNLRILKRQINRSIKVDDDWEVFKMYFLQINTTFFDKLKVINPELTKYDLRFAALIKLNLNIKETEAVLNLSPNSIKSARYKLRKRLNLNQEQDLYEFIQAV
jgi:hypothetical protein